MLKRYRSAAVGVAALLLTSSLAVGAGMWSTLPIIGGASFCASTVSGASGLSGATGQGQATGGSICGQTVPAGPPALVGTETTAVDINSTVPGAPPATANVPISLIGSTNTKVNRLIGGDFTTNLWQRGTTFSALTPTTTTMTADRWGVYSSGNTVTVSRQAGSADTIPALGYYASMRVSRPSGTNTTQICVGQVLDKNAAAELIGNNGVFSFYALAGAGLNAVASNNITATIAYYTAADSATPGTNTDAFMKGTVAGYQAVTAQSPFTTSAIVASGVATVPISTTWTRYAVYGAVPATNAAGTAVTGAGVTLCYTPTSGTGGSTEWFEFTAAQLQALPSVAGQNMPNGVTSPTGFERRLPQVEADYQLWYSQVLTDGAATLRYGLGQATTTTSANIVLALQPMRIVPSTTVGTAASFAVTVAAGTAQNCTTLAAVASSNTLYSAGLACTVAANLAAGNATQFIGQATGGLLTFSAEP